MQLQHNKRYIAAAVVAAVNLVNHHQMGPFGKNVVHRHRGQDAFFEHIGRPLITCIDLHQAVATLGANDLDQRGLAKPRWSRQQQNLARHQSIASLEETSRRIAPACQAVVMGPTVALKAVVAVVVTRKKRPGCFSDSPCRKRIDSIAATKRGPACSPAAPKASRHRI